RAHDGPACCSHPAVLVPGQPEVRDPGTQFAQCLLGFCLAFPTVGGGEKHITRLEITVDDALLMGVSNGTRQLVNQLCRVMCRPGFPDAGEQGSTRNVFKDQIGTTAVVSHRIESDDPWMIEPRYQPGFLEETSSVGLECPTSGAKDLQRHVPVEVRLPGEVH